MIDMGKLWKIGAGNADMRGMSREEASELAEDAIKAIALGKKPFPGGLADRLSPANGCYADFMPLVDNAFDGEVVRLVAPSSMGGDQESTLYTHASALDCYGDPESMRATAMFLLFFWSMCACTAFMNAPLPIAVVVLICIAIPFSFAWFAWDSGRLARSVTLDMSFPARSEVEEKAHELGIPVDDAVAGSHYDYCSRKWDIARDCASVASSGSSRV
jgi:hypothetical protein